MQKKEKDNKSLELFTDQEICELREAFNIFDIESDGSIETSQLKILMNTLKIYPNDKELEQIIAEADPDNSNQIYFNTFLKIIGKRRKNKKNDEIKYLKKLFKYLDRNNNGLISIREIRYIVVNSNENISEKDIEFLMKEADTDGDGYISLEEFLTVMKS